MIIGVCSNPCVITYDLDAMMSHWAREFSDEDINETQAYEMAWEWYENKVLGVNMGEHTPIYVSKSSLDHIEDSL